MPSNWRGFELLAEQIYSELATYATVQHDDSIYGHQTESYRQIDVSIRWSEGDREHLAIVQAKDWKGRANIIHVGEFTSVVRDVEADKGVMICRGGFSKKAHTYARNIGIELHNLHDAQSKDWSRSLTIPIVWSELTPEFSLQVEARMNEGDQVAADRFGFVDVAGVQRDFQELFVERWNAGLLPRTSELVHLYDPGGAVTVRVVRSDGSLDLREAKNVVLQYRVSRKSWLGQFEPSVCRGYIDYLAGSAFVTSHLPVGEIPSQKGETWVPVTDPDRVAVSVAGTVVTTEQFEINLQDSSVSLTFRRIGA